MTLQRCGQYSFVQGVKHDIIITEYRRRVNIIIFTSKSTRRYYNF